MRLSRIMRHVAAFSLAVCLVAPALFCAPVLRAADRESAATKQPARENDNGSPADELVRQALKAEIDGDGQRRAAYLADALAADPDNAPAHWHSGEVRSGDQWTSIADARRQVGKVAEYRQRRERAGNTAVGQLSLAHWCAAAGLSDSERVHLIQAMQLNPTKSQSRDITRRLGHVRYQGVLMSPAQAERLKADQKKREAAFREWKPRLARLGRDIEVRDANKRSEAIAELRALRDPAALPALESVFSKVRPATGVAAIAAISEMPGQAATDSLLRFAVLADQEDVRTAAATALGTRNVYAYVPTLIAALQAPVEVTFEADFSTGSAHHRLVLFQEGPVVDQKFTRIDGTHEDVMYSRRLGRVLRERLVGDQTLAVDAARASAEVAANDERERMNARVMAVLKTATEKDFDDNLKLWWDWWLSENEIYQTPYKQVEETTSVTPAVQVRYVSCFPAGTPVETSTGTLTIEQIKPGDCVLAQDPDSGELDYKPVMAVTLRPPSQLIEVRTEKDTIRATRGHPFWVAGIGWQMAKELKAGQWLHTVAGPVLIESAEERGEAECHNLVVADFNSYFVGRDRILVHDNNLRQVTTATVPGLVNP